jgi:DNA processing protein
MNETYFYNAVAIAAFGDYDAIKDLHAPYASWEETYCALRDKGDLLLPEPEAAFEELLKSDVQLILYSDDAYPPRLREIPHPPFALYIKGDPAALLHNSSFAIVGTRRASPEGKNTARHFARELAEVGFAIVSGLAFGIDAAAHEGYLEATINDKAICDTVPCDGAPNICPAIAVAVLAGGLRSIYPHNNEQLGRAILAHGGAIVSEYPMGEPPLKQRFIARNRIISGLARGTLVIEAPFKSGALSTARFALEQNRDVFVVPGNITQANFAGSNLLIQQGASLVTSPNDILQTYGMVKERRAAKAARTARERAALTAEESLVIGAFANAHTILDVDKIIIMTRLEPRIVNQTLTLLLMKDFIKEERGGYMLKK